MPYLFYRSLDKGVSLISDALCEVKASYLRTKPIFDDFESRFRVSRRLHVGFGGRHPGEAIWNSEEMSGSGESRFAALVECEIRDGVLKEPSSFLYAWAVDHVHRLLLLKRGDRAPLPKFHIG